MSKETFPQDSSPEIMPKSIDKYDVEDEELQEALGHIWDIAGDYHLDPFPTHFEVVPANIMNQIGAYGIPNRFSHWTFGRAYREMQTNYEYGLSKIYELVINSNPSQAFLLENNPPIDNKFVMAHVLGHTDFFKNNFRFAHTRRDMPNVAAENAERIRGYEDEFGRLRVEGFLDATLALEQHIDPFNPNRPSREEELKMWHDNTTVERPVNDVKKHTGEFDDLFEPRKQEPLAQIMGRAALHIPPTPDRDVLGFIRNHAPYLEDWQRDIVDIVRSDSVYFYPQRRTKIMNEGWAAYWHKRIMREMGNRGFLRDEENEPWWNVHSHVVAPNPRSLNPYYLGMKMYEYLEDRFNGNLSEEEEAWLVLQGKEVFPHFEGKLEDSPASSKLRDIMMHNDDQSIIRNYFDKNIADRMNMYIFKKITYPDGSEHNVVTDDGWEHIHDKLVSNLDNAGTPHISVINGDHNHSGELYLRHEFDGRTLDDGYVRKTLPHVCTLWQRSVYLETTKKDGTKKLYVCDGKNVTCRDVAPTT